MKTRFYLSSAGYIIDSQTSRELARMKAHAGWRSYGERLCAALEADPANEAALLSHWAEHLRP